MSMVTVDGNTYPVYGDLAGAVKYIAGLFSPAAATWRALIVNEQSRTLVAARYYLDSESWMSTASNANADGLDWPRVAATYADGTPIASTVVPPEVISAEYELAVIIATNPDVVSAAGAGTNTKLLKTGPLEVEFFLPTVAIPGLNTKLPTVLMRLVGQFLAGAQGGSSGVVSGACGDSQFTDCSTLKRSGPLS